MKKIYDPFFEEYDNMSLEELHKKAYESIDKEDNYNFGDEEQSIPNEYNIEEYIKNPYDYGSKEYNEAMTKILKNREKYRKEVLEKQNIRYNISKSIER